MNRLPEPILFIVLDYVALTMDGLRAACVCKQWEKFMYEHNRPRLLFAVSCLVKAARGLNGCLLVYESTRDDKYDLVGENPIIYVNPKCKDTFELSIWSETTVSTQSGNFHGGNGVSLLLKKSQRYLDFMSILASGMEKVSFSMVRTCSYEKVVEIIVNLLELGFLTLELNYSHLTTISSFKFPSTFNFESNWNGVDYITQAKILHFYYHITRDDIKKVERSEIGEIATLRHPKVVLDYIPKSKCIII